MTVDLHVLKSALGKNPEYALSILQPLYDSASFTKSRAQAYVKALGAGISITYKTSEWQSSYPGIKIDNGPYFAVAVHLHSGVEESFSKYSGSLPGGVSFGDSFESVVQKIGNPIVKGGGTPSRVVDGIVPIWCKHICKDGTALHFQFDNNIRLRSASIMLERVGHY